MKTVVLVDWNWTGHHPTYFRKLLLGFRSCGARVLAMCPEASIPEIRDLLDSEIAGDGGAGAVDFIPVRRIGERVRLPAFVRSWDQGRRMFGGIAACIRRWEESTGEKVSLVFFATIYDFDFENFRHAGNTFPYPWSGIYLHARAFRLPGTPMPYVNRMPCPEKIFTLASMSSACVIDEGAVAPMEKLSGGKPVFEFPDITDCTVEEFASGPTLAEKVIRFAAGRKLVVCLGHLQKTKGIHELCKAARDPGLEDVCFFFGGEVNWVDMSREEAGFIRSTWEQAPNVLTHLARISDATMNALIVAADVVFAAYTNFPNSSNVMTKAAYFRRPIIVSNGFLMAERVRLHKTGRIVPEGDVAAIVSAISELLANKPLDVPGYGDYYEKHSVETLIQVLGRVLQANGKQHNS